MKTKKTRIRVIITGRVQGVFFRQKTKEKAQSLSLTGWVKNLPNGQVEAIFEGEKENIKKIIAFLWVGPPLARVDNLDIQEEPYQGEFASFEIKYF
jgi:acylphosphatase